MGKIIIRILLVLVLIAAVSLCIYEFIQNQTISSRTLVRGGLVVAFTIISFIRTFQSRGRQSLEFYEQQYSEILGDAFSENPLDRKKLLCAVRLYNENRFEKALKYLADLKSKANLNADHFAVDLFSALCFTDMHLYEQAIRIYKNMVATGRATSDIYSNYGLVLLNTGDYKNAIYYYKIAVEQDPTNAIAYNNIAQAHFHLQEFDEAISYAKQALDINIKLKPASSLLAIIYSLISDKENANKYFHMAINSGQNPQELKEAIEYFQTAQFDPDDDAEPQD